MKTGQLKSWPVFCFIPFDLEEIQLELQIVSNNFSEWLEMLFIVFPSSI